MEKYLKFDDQVTVLTKHKELQQYLQFRKENDVWVQPYIKETTVVGIEDHPLFLSQYFLSNGIELNDESNECVKDTGMFLTFPMNGERKIYPTRHTAFTSICQRAGLSGPTISNFIGSAFKKVLPVTEKASWLTRGFSLYMQKCKILIRDGKISAMINFHTANLRPTKSLGVREPRVWLSETKRKTPECSGVSFFRAGNSNSLTNAFHICVYVHLCVVPRYIASQHPWKQSQSLLQNTKETTAGHFRRSVFLLSGRIPGVHELLWKAASLSCGRYR